jgi:hypothetical protein
MKAELPENTGTDSGPPAVAASPDSGSIVLSAEASESSRWSNDETFADSSSSSVKSTSESSKGKQKAKDVQPIEEKPTPKKETTADNLVGKINNLVTTDLNNITEARDFLFIGKRMLSLYLKWGSRANYLGSSIRSFTGYM